MKKHSLLKKIICVALIAVQCSMALPAVKAFAAQDNTKELGWAETKFEDEEDLKAQIIKSNVFTRAWATHAYQLGFLFCNGTNKKIVGQGFDFSKEFENGKHVYYLKAHYDANDPLGNKPRSNERLEMKISNVRFIMDPSTLKFGEVKLVEEKPLIASSKEVMNGDNTEATSAVSFVYTVNTSVSRVDNYKFSEKIGLKVGFEAEIPFIAKSKVETSFEFGMEQGWSSSNGSSTTKTLTNIDTVKVPPRSKKTVELVSIQRKSEVPYTAKMYMEYDMELTGIVNKDNAFKDHPQDYQTRTVKYGKDGMSAAENLLDIYKHRDINGYSNIDWNWLFTNRKQKGVEAMISTISKVHYGGILNGKFISIDGSHTQIKAHASQKLTKEELADLDYVEEDIDTPRALPLLSNEKMKGITEMAKDEVKKGIKFKNFKTFNTENIMVHK